MVVELVPKIDAMMLSMTLKSNAHQKPSTAKPGTNQAMSRMIRAFMTSRNNPKLKIVTGIVRKTSKGLRKVFRIASAMATIMAVVNFSMVTPGNIQAVSSTAPVYINNLIMTFIR